jgi:polyhydroxybutyrate depolymerase
MDARTARLPRSCTRTMGATIVALALIGSACSGVGNRTSTTQQPVTTQAETSVASSTVGAVSQPAETGEISMTVDGLGRVFTVVRPPRVGPNAPLVVLLHGGTRSMRTVLDRAGTGDWVALAEKEGFVLVAPNGVNPATGDATGDRQQWNDLRSPFNVGDSEIDDVTFINRVVEWMIRNHEVDPDRVFVTGLSNGGMMTQRLLIETPEVYAAGASFIANIPDRSDLVRPESPKPLLLASATDDPLMPWDGGNVATRNRGTVASVVDTRTWWIETNRAVPDDVGPVQLEDAVPSDDCTLTLQGFDAGSGGAELLILTMEGGGHSMPSTNYTLATEALIEPLVGPVCRDADGVDIAWDFFMSISG